MTANWSVGWRGVGGMKSYLVSAVMQGGSRVCRVMFSLRCIYIADGPSVIYVGTFNSRLGLKDDDEIYTTEKIIQFQVTQPHQPTIRPKSDSLIHINLYNQLMVETTHRQWRHAVLRVVWSELKLDRQVGRSGKTLLLLGHGLAAEGEVGNGSQVFTASICWLFFGLLV